MVPFSPGGKVALVTGAQRGIGWETARLLHARGAAVVLVDLDEDATEAAAQRIGGDRVLALGADVTDAEAMEQAVEAAVERFGGLDIVVANAGIAPPAVTMRAIEPDVFERVVAVDLLGVWRTVKPALSQITERRGHVVVVASVYAFSNGVMNASYAISKAGVEQLGRALRVELVPHGASASVAYFGFIDTRMVRDAVEDPVVERLLGTLPAFATKRLTPAAAGQAIVTGVERRSPRIFAPGWWRGLSALRGVMSPLTDRYAERDADMQAAVREADRAERPERAPAPPGI